MSAEKLRNTSLSILVGEQSHDGTAASLTYNPIEDKHSRKAKISFSVASGSDDFQLGELKGTLEMFANQAFNAMFQGQQDQIFAMEIGIESGINGKLFCFYFEAKQIPDEQELIDIIAPLSESGIRSAALRVFINDICNSGKDKWVGGGITFDTVYSADGNIKALVNQFVPSPARPLVLLNNVRIELASIEELKTVWSAFPELEEVEAKYSMLVPLVRMLAMDTFEDMGVTKERVVEHYKQPFGDLFDAVASSVKTIDSVDIQYRGHELKLQFTEFNILDILPRSFTQILDFLYL